MCWKLDELTVKLHQIGLPRIWREKSMRTLLASDEVSDYWLDKEPVREGVVLVEAWCRSEGSMAWGAAPGLDWAAST
jgi:hypothetical protein